MKNEEQPTNDPQTEALNIASVGSSNKCQCCEKNDAQEEHTCPFKEEINYDSETMCNCCEDCAYECAMGI